MVVVLLLLLLIVCWIWGGEGAVSEAGVLLFGLVAEVCCIGLLLSVCGKMDL